MSEEQKKDLPEIKAVDSDVRIGSVKIPKKVAFEIDVEKALRWIIVFGVLIAVCIYGYKGIKSIDFSSAFGNSTKVAVLDMPGLKKEFYKNTRPSGDNENPSARFEKYFSKLMRFYRSEGYLVIDYSLTYSIPNTVKIVTYIDNETLSQSVTSSDIDSHDETEAAR
ncbi:transcriptional regulator [Lelliottia amnigena]|uniref:transcriptional regulator n=1 Tax=Lelliottia TaxID=1330545 RepID=UPI00192C19AF|nr:MULTISPECIES: transcriptional regulator [Lelliottia]MBL5885664.1 transcriptional regulator [Lelliottia aquatilis]MBL5923242.1 transcriptional regulator [Lelliottia amnigena]MBL5932152.1 transcriptional regulator [Lelliottia amnigena]